MSYYGVKNGRIPGVYSTWTEAEAQVKGFSGAVHAKFKTFADAQAYVGGTQATQIKPSVQPAAKPSGQLYSPPVVVPSSQPVKSIVTGYEVWTDGSADLNKAAGYAWVIVKDGCLLKEGGGKILVGDMTAPQAELFGTIEGSRAIYTYFVEELKCPLQDFTSHCDNEMVMKTINLWGPKRTTSDWKDKAYAAEFINLLAFVEGYRQYAKATYVHVPGHAGLKWNEYVDKLSRRYRTS
ncbi:Ribonuclease H [uncultured virus]|nr:Ribonuclease H [uncultured virus]